MTTEKTYEYADVMQALAVVQDHGVGAVWAALDATPTYELDGEPVASAFFGYKHLVMSPGAAEVLADYANFDLGGRRDVEVKPVSHGITFDITTFEYQNTGREA